MNGVPRQFYSAGDMFYIIHVNTKNLDEISKNAETQNRSKIDGFCLTLHVFVMKVI